MDLSQSTQGEEKNEQPQHESSHSLSSQHTNTSPLIVSIPRSIREQHITEIASNDTLQRIVSIPRIHHRAAESEKNVSVPYPLKETNSISKQSHSDINSRLARKRLSTRTRGETFQPSSTPSGIPPSKTGHLDNSQQLAGSSRQYESDDSDSTCIQQYDSDSSQQDSETEEHSIGQTTPASDQFLDFIKIYEKLFEARAKWYNLGLALGLDTGTLDSIKHNNKECEDCLREALKQRDNTTKLTWTEIIKALRNPIVGKHQLANKIQTKFAQESMSQSSSQPSSGATPECVVRYASFLKDKYKQMSPFPDDWPPPLKDKFTKLALIERKKQICLTQAKHQPSIEYDYATGNVDSIVERKKAITPQQIFEPLSGDSEIAAPNRYTIVMDGAPGVGKTTLSRKICIDWAQGKLIKDHHIVILKPLRELRGHTSATLYDLLHSEELELHVREEIVKHIRKTSGSGVMFIFDGFDELSSKRFDKKTIFWEIIRGNHLYNCSVLVTSRSYASGPLQEINRVNRHVEVLGFKKKDIEHCIKQNVTDKEKAKKLIQMLKERLDIVSLCYIPLNCRIVLYVYQQQGTLPDTLTQLYEVFILYTFKHYKNKIFLEREHDIDQIEHVYTMKKLPTQVIKCLDCLSETAFTGMTQDKLVFKYTEVTKERGALSLGLLNLTKCTGVLEAHYYQFLHITIQEFLAARHLALTKSNRDKLVFITSKIGDDRFRMTLLFLSGLTQLDFLPVEQAFPAPKSIDTCVEHKYKTKTKSMPKHERSRFLFLAHLLFESRQTTHNWLLPCLVTNSLNFSGHNLSQFDCLVLANFLALTPKDHVWDEINLSQCSLNADKIELLVSKKHSQRDISVLCLTKQLDICSYPSVRIFKQSFTALFREDSKLENVQIPPLEELEGIICCKLSVGEALLRAISLQELILTSNYNRLGADIITKSEIRIETMQICSGVIQNCFESLEHRKVKTIVLCKPDSFEDCSQCSSSGSDAWESLCNVIKNTKHIQHLQIHKHHFNAQDISSLMATLQNKRNLRTLQIGGSNISHGGLIHLRNNLPVNVRADISTYELNFKISIDNNLVRVDLELRSLFPQETFLHSYTALLEEDLPPELHGVTVSTKSLLSKALLRSVGNSKIVTSLTVANLSDEQFTKFAGDFRDMLKETKFLQTLKLHSCRLNDTSIKHLEDGLSLNEAVALKLDYEYTLKNALKVRSQNLYELNVKGNTLSKEDMRQLLEIVTKCKQLRILKVRLEDNSESFFHALSDNQNLRELSIHTTGKMSVLLFQTLPSTSITKLDLNYWNKVLGNEGSLAFKEFIYRNKVLTILRANRCGLTDEAFRGISFTHESPLRELYFGENLEVDKGWTELFNALRSSRITILDISGNTLCGEECCTALNCLLLKNKTLIVLRIGSNKPRCDNDEMVCCIADALSQNCSLRELKIRAYSLSIQGWIKLFKSLYENTRLKTLNCIDAECNIKLMMSLNLCVKC